MSYSTFSSKTVSEKIILAHAHSVKRAFFFTLDDKYYKVLNDVVVGVKINGVSLTSTTSKSNVDSTHFYYEISTKKLWINSYSEDDEIIVKFRHFFSNVPINLSWDLQDYSEEVEYLPRISGHPNFKSQASKNGITLTGSGSLKLLNNDDVLTSLLNKNVFENKEVTIYSFGRGLKPSEAIPLFRGFISGKNISSTEISFSLKDALFALETPVLLNKYSSLVIDDHSDRLKRRVFGKVQNMLCQSIDQVGNGYAVQGTVTGIKDNEYVIGSGTSFLQDLSPNDVVSVGGIEITVDSVVSDTCFSCAALTGTFYNQTIILKPKISHYNKNRRIQVCDHALKVPNCVVTKVISRNRVDVDSTENFKQGDKVELNSEILTIRRISNSTIVFTRCVSYEISINDTITKKALYKVQQGNKELSLNDITLDNSSSGCFLNLSSQTEFNSTTNQRANLSFRFFQGKNKVWLGSPTFTNLTCVGQTVLGTGQQDYSLFGKYFSFYDEDGYESCFWFSDNLEQTLTTKPSYVAAVDAIKGNKVKRVGLESRAYSSNEIALLVADIVCSTLSCWTYTISNNVIYFTSKEAVSLNNGTAGTSGFSFSSFISGVNSNSKLDLKTILKSRDFIKDTQGNNWYEVLEVGEKYFTIRTNYSNSTTIDNLVYKSIDYIQDDSKILVDCYGGTVDNTSTGEAIDTPIKVIKTLLIDILDESLIDLESFDSTIEKIASIVSLSLPLKFDDESIPTTKDIVNSLLQSCNAILFLTSDLKIGCDLIDSEIVNLRTITDSDIISWSYKADNVGSTLTSTVNYNFQDYNSSLDDSTKEIYTFTSETASKYIETSASQETDAYLYEEYHASLLARRNQFINELSFKVISIKAGLSLFDLKVGQKVYINTKRHVGIGQISTLINTGSYIELEVSDYGDIIRKCAKIQENDSLDYQTSDSTTHVYGSYITENNGIIEGDEDVFGYYLIS